MPLTLFFLCRKCVFYFIILIFIKYLQYCHCHQYTNHREQPFEGVNALKFHTFLILSHFLCVQITSLSLSLQIHPKTWRFWFQIVQGSKRYWRSWFLVINELVAIVLKFWVIGETTQVISRVEVIKSLFFQICSRRRLL